MSRPKVPPKKHAQDKRPSRKETESSLRNVIDTQLKDIRVGSIPDSLKSAVIIITVHVNGNLYQENVRKLTRKTTKTMVANSPGAAVAHGRKAKATAQARDITIWPKDIDAKHLIEQLNTLRDAMHAEAKEPEQDDAVAEISHARKAAEAGDFETTKSRLQQAGRWALGFAEKLGLETVENVIGQAFS